MWRKQVRTQQKKCIKQLEYMMSALTPPKGAELNEKVIGLFCTKSKAHVAVGRQL